MTRDYDIKCHFWPPAGLNNAIHAMAGWVPPLTRDRRLRGFQSVPCKVFEDRTEIRMNRVFISSECNACHIKLNEHTLWKMPLMHLRFFSLFVFSMHSTFRKKKMLTKSGQFDKNRVMAWTYSVLLCKIQYTYLDW